MRGGRAYEGRKNSRVIISNERLIINRNVLWANPILNSLGLFSVNEFFLEKNFHEFSYALLLIALC